MSKQIKATPESFHTSILTPIILQDTPNVSITFNGLQVDNQNNNKNIKGSLIIRKKTSKVKDFNEISKFTRKDISPYDEVELNFDTTATYALGKGLYEYYRLFGGKQTNPYEEVTFVESSDSIEHIKILLESNDKLAEILKSIDTSTLNSALNIQNLINLKSKIEKNMENSDEKFWQDFFSTNAWVLSQIFTAPLMICDGARYIGGKNIKNSNSEIADFIYKNNLTNNIALIEIKTPCTKLFTNSHYRENTLIQSNELIGAIEQLLSQKQTLLEDYANIRNHSLDDFNVDFFVQNIKCVLLIGKTCNLNTLAKKQFERYRNELRSIDIITFDELLERVNALLELLVK